MSLILLGLGLGLRLVRVRVRVRLWVRVTVTVTITDQSAIATETNFNTLFYTQDLFFCRNNGVQASHVDLLRQIEMGASKRCM